MADYSVISTSTLQHTADRDMGQYVNERVVALSRQMTMAMLLITVVVFLSLLISVPESTVMLRWLAAMTVAFGLGIFLHHKGVYQYNQILLSTGLSLVLLFSTIHSKLANAEIIHEGSYFNPRYFLIGLSFIPLVVFDLRRQPKLLMMGVGVNIAILALYMPLHSLFDADAEHILGVPLKNNAFVTIASTSAAVAIALGMYFLKKANFRYEGQVEGLLAKTAFQNDELNAGIRYAMRLQTAALQSEEDLDGKQARIAVFQSAKDTLSGDFFFYDKRDNCSFISVIDCTGHGVPGAFVSLMGNTSLRQAMAQSRCPLPNDVLGTMHAYIKEEFLNSKSADFQDGMDMALCRIDHEKAVVNYASANGIGYIVGANGIKKLKSQRRSIGDSNLQPFECYSEKFNPGDLLVLTSDGYRDQFGGPRDKKYGSRNFTGLIEELAKTPTESRKFFLRQTFEAWKGSADQTDDVCVLVMEL